MPWKSWSTLVSRWKRRRRPRPSHLDPFQPHIYRLEDRRVLDVSAAFSTTTAQLQLFLTNTADTAAVTVTNGEIRITDSQQQNVAIQVDGQGPAAVNASSVDSIAVQGDAAPDQRVVFLAELTLPDGLSVAASIERATLHETLSRIDSGPVTILAKETELAGDLLTTGQEVRFGGDVRLLDDVRITGADVRFEKRVDDDGVAATASRLRVDASGTTSFEGIVGGLARLNRLETDSAGRTHLAADLSGADGFHFADPVTLKGDVTIDAAGPSGIVWGSTLHSDAGAHHEITLTTTQGSIRFNGDVGSQAGGDHRLGQLTIRRADGGVWFGDTSGVSKVDVLGSLNLGSVAVIGGPGVILHGGSAPITITSGAARWNAPLLLTTDTVMNTTAGGIVFTSATPIDSQNNFVSSLTLNAGAGAVQFNADLGVTSPLRGITIARADGGVTLGGASSIDGTGQGPVRRIQSVDRVSIGTSSQPISQIVLNPGDAHTLRITTTGDDVLFNGPVRLLGDLEISTGDGPGDVDFLTGPIDGETGEANDLTLHAGTGSIRFNHDLGRTATLGQLIITRADGGVEFGTAATRGSGFGPTGLVRTTGPIDIGVGASEIAGVGIVLRAATGTEFAMNSTAGTVRLNGPLTLDSDLQITAAGDVTFTNDTPIDSRTGSSHSLTVTSSAGKVSFHEDIGRTVPLHDLVVRRSPLGVTIGGSTTEIHGTGTSGPVEWLRLTGRLDLGQDAIVGGSGIVLSGSATAPLVLETVDHSQRFHGAVTLQTDVALRTGPNGSGVLFTSASPIDSGTGRRGGLSIDAGSGRVEFNRDLGAVRGLGALTVVRADGGVVFGGQDPAVANSPLQGVVQQIRVDQPIDLGTGTHTIGGVGIVFHGGDQAVTVTTTEDHVRLNGEVRLESDLRIFTGDGAGDILFTSAATIDSSEGRQAATTSRRSHLTIDAGDGAVSFNANVGRQQMLASLMVDRAAAGVTFGGADAAVLGGLGPVTFVEVDGPIDLGSGDTADDRLGSIVLNGGNAALRVQTTGKNVRFNGPTLLHSNVVLNTGAGGGDLLFTSHASIDGQSGELRDLHVVLNAGDVRFLGDIGQTTRLNEFRLQSVDDADFAKAVSAARVVQDAGSGTTTFRDRVSTSHATESGLQLRGSGFVFEAPVSALGDGRVTIEHTEALTILAAADFRTDGAFRASGGPLRIAGDIATSGDTIDLHGPVTLTPSSSGQVLLSTVAGGQAAGGDITIHAALNPTAAGVEGLLINAGTGGDIRFVGPLGNAVRLGNVTIVQADDVTASAALKGSRWVQLDGQGRTHFQAIVDLHHATLRPLDVRTDELVLSGNVTTSGHGAVQFVVDASLEVAAGTQWSLEGAFQQLGPGLVRWGADLTTTNDDIGFTSPVRLTSDVRLDTGASAGVIRFGSTLDSDSVAARDLTLRVATDLLFAGSMGAAAPLDQLVVETAREVRFASSVTVAGLNQQEGSGRTSVESTLITTGAGGVQLRTREVSISGTIDVRSAGSGPVTLRTAEAIGVTGAIRSTDQVIDLHAGTDIRLEGSAIVESERARINLTAGTQIAMGEAAVVDSGSAPLFMTAGQDITLGTLLSNDHIELTSLAGAILDGGDLRGANIVTPRLALRSAAGVGTAGDGTGKNPLQIDPLEVSVSTFAATNSTTGGVYVVNDHPGPLVIGSVAGVEGIQNQGAGAIQITTPNDLFVDARIAARGGGDTSLRAGLGDLVVRQPVHNTGGDGSLFLFAGDDLVIRNSLPEPPGKIENPANPEEHFEILVSGTGAIRGQARGEVLVDRGETDYVIIRTATGQVTNLPPILSIRALDQGGSDIDAQGRGFVEVKVGDNVHLETNYHIQIDWGDGEIESYPVPGTIHPERLPGNRDPRFDSGDFGRFGTREPGVYVFSHKYFTHPNPKDPAAPIPIKVELRWDARTSGEASIDANYPTDGSSIFNGIRFVNNVNDSMVNSLGTIFSVPGTGNFTFVKVVTSIIVPVELRTTIAPPPLPTAVSFTSSGGLRNDLRAVRFETQAQAEYALFLRVVDDVQGTESEERIALDLKWLNDPLGLFRSRNFPNGHYRIYLEEVRTRRVRLILDIHMFDDKVVPENFRDGAGERQPGAGEVQPVERPEDAAPERAEPASDENASTGSVRYDGTIQETQRASQVMLDARRHAEPINSHDDASMPRFTRIAHRLRQASE